MKKTIFLKGQFVILNQTVKASCGTILAGKYQLVKICNPEPDTDNDITVYVNKSHEDGKKYLYICISKFDIATDEQIKEKLYLYESH